MSTSRREGFLFVQKGEERVAFAEANFLNDERLSAEAKSLSLCRPTRLLEPTRFTGVFPCFACKIGHLGKSTN